MHRAIKYGVVEVKFHILNLSTWWG